MKNKNILITGGAGFIGSSFVRLVSEHGYNIIVLDKLTYAGKRENIKGVPNVKLVVGDIADGALVAKLLDEHKPRYLVNIAAETHVDNSIESPADFIGTNISGTYILLEAARRYWSGLKDKSKFRFVQISTDEVYGELGATGKFRETTPYSPNSPYSASKAAADHLVHAWWHTYGLPVVITHCSNNYGPRQFPEKLIPLVISRMITGEHIPLYGDGSNVRDWIHVNDHANGIMLAMENGRDGEHYAFGGNAERSNMELVKSLCAIMDELHPRKDGKKHESAIKLVKDRPGHDKRYAIDDSKARKELGFKRNYVLKRGLRDTVKWYLDNQQ